MQKRNQPHTSIHTHIVRKMRTVKAGRAHHKFREVPYEQMQRNADDSLGGPIQGLRREASPKSSRE